MVFCSRGLELHLTHGNNEVGGQESWVPTILSLLVHTWKQNQEVESVHPPWVTIL